MKPWFVLLALALAVPGCFSAEEEPAPGDGAPAPGDDGAAPDADAPAEREPVAVDVSLSGAYPVNSAYVPPRIEVPAESRVTVTFRNTDTTPGMSHNWVLEGVDGAETDAIATGASATAEFDAPAPGEYAFYCSVPGHRDRGMEGTFVVA